MQKSVYGLIVVLIVVGGLVFWQRSSRDVSPDVSFITPPQRQAGERKLRIGLSHYVSHPVMDTVVEGIKLGFHNAGYLEGTDIVFDRQNAQGDPMINQRIAETFASSEDDLFMPIGTPPSQALVAFVKDRPIVFAAVTDPVAAGLIQDKEQPEANVTGSSDITLYEEQLQLIKRLAPTARTIGIVYSSGEANARSALKEVQQIAPALGFMIKTASVSSTKEILTAARSLAASVDAFYMLPDNVVASGQEAYIRVALETKKPFISLDQSGVEKGALATVGTNYRLLGERTASIAIRILQGAKPTDFPVLNIRDADLFINAKTAAVIGLTIDEETLAKAKQVYRLEQ